MNRRTPDNKGTPKPGTYFKSSAIEEERVGIERRAMEQKKRAKRLKQYQKQAQRGKPLEYNEI